MSFPRSLQILHHAHAVPPPAVRKETGSHNWCGIYPRKSNLAQEKKISCTQSCLPHYHDKRCRCSAPTSGLFWSQVSDSIKTLILRQTLAEATTKDKNLTSNVLMIHSLADTSSKDLELQNLFCWTDFPSMSGFWCLIPEFSAVKKISGDMGHHRTAAHEPENYKFCLAQNNNNMQGVVTSTTRIRHPVSLVDADVDAPGLPLARHPKSSLTLASQIPIGYAPSHSLIRWKAKHKVHSPCPKIEDIPLKLRKEIKRHSFHSHSSNAKRSHPQQNPNQASLKGDRFSHHSLH